MGSLFSGGPPPNAMNQAGNPYGAAGTLEMNNTNQQANAYKKQGLIANEEGVRNAIQTAVQGHHYREEQAIQADNSGILLSGSPLLNLEYTRSQVQQEADATVAAAKAQGDQLYQSAQAILNNGRASLLGQQDSFITENAQNKIQAISRNAQMAGSLFSSGLNAVNWLFE